MYGMFSKKEQPQQSYHTYKFYNQDQLIDIKKLDFRKYTVLMNTIAQYDAIINNEMEHPEAEAIDKFVNRLHLENTTVNSQLKSAFQFSKEQLDPKIGIWVSQLLNTEIRNLRIEKEEYQWTSIQPNYKNKQVIFDGFK